MFYDDTKNFLMEVKPGIVVNFYEAESNSTKPMAKVVLDQRATSVKVRTSKRVRVRHSLKTHDNIST